MFREIDGGLPQQSTLPESDGRHQAESWLIPPYEKMRGMCTPFSVDGGATDEWLGGMIVHDSAPLWPRPRRWIVMLRSMVIAGRIHSSLFYRLCVCDAFVQIRTDAEFLPYSGGGGLQGLTPGSAGALWCRPCL